MKLLHNYIAIERVFDKQSESSGILIEEQFPQKIDTVIYSGREDISPGDKVVYKKHTEQYMEDLGGGRQRKLWFIHPDDTMGVFKQ